MPVVAVVSESMEHDTSLQTDYYKWLEVHMGYNRNYIDSWPIAYGFMRGDMPIVQRQQQYAVGDVIVYSIPNQNVPIIHRIIKINDDGSYMTKGDNNPSLLPFEASVKQQQIHGKVIFIIPKLGYFKVIISDIFGIR
jgi:signal peptidase I